VNYSGVCRFGTIREGCDRKGVPYHVRQGVLENHSLWPDFAKEAATLSNGVQAPSLFESPHRRQLPCWCYTANIEPGSSQADRGRLWSSSPCRDGVVQCRAAAPEPIIRRDARRPAQIQLRNNRRLQAGCARAVCPRSSSSATSISAFSPRSDVSRSRVCTSSASSNGARA
jgi:hypothetical protein